jgi:hypothetical protein
MVVAALAFLVDRTLEKKLRAAGSSLSSPAAWQALETIRCVEVAVGHQRKVCVTRGSRQAAEVLQAVGFRSSIHRIHLRRSQPLCSDQSKKPLYCLQRVTGPKRKHALGT